MFGTRFRNPLMLLSVSRGTRFRIPLRGLSGLRASLELVVPAHPIPVPVCRSYDFSMFFLLVLNILVS